MKTTYVKKRNVIFLQDKKWLVHGGNPRCLDADLHRKTIYVTNCDADSETQRWNIEHINYKALVIGDD